MPVSGAGFGGKRCPFLIANIRKEQGGSLLS
jgi:hypothetical protein